MKIDNFFAELKRRNVYKFQVSSAATWKKSNESKQDYLFHH